jgi:hypothetical protein
MGKFLTDPIWWIYLFWLPDFLNKTYGLDLKGVALPIIIIPGIGRRKYCRWLVFLIFNEKRLECKPRP